MTRNEILTAAAQIFGQKGYHATSMQDIAQAVNLQKASLYHHVSSKQEILVDLLNQALDLLIENMNQVLEMDIPVEQKLRKAVKVYLTTLVNQRDLASVLLLEHRSLDPEFHAHHIPRRDRYERLWRDLVNKGIEEGVFCCVEPSMAAKAFLGVVNWTITWFRSDGPLSADEIADQFTDLFLHGLTKRAEEGD